MAASPAESLRIRRSAADDDALFDVAAAAAAWSAAPRHRIELSPTPLGLLIEISPYVARSTGHGALRALELRMLHNGGSLSIHLAWEDSSHDERVADLDEFVDAAAVMFPLAEGANPLTMGDPERPVNMWYWKADQSGPFDVIARGYATSMRRPAAESGLRARSAHDSAGWRVVLQRSLAASDPEHVPLRPGDPIELGLALWQGSNAERAGQKAVTPTFLSGRLDP